MSNGPGSRSDIGVHVWSVVAGAATVLVLSAVVLAITGVGRDSSSDTRADQPGAVITVEAPMSDALGSSGATAQSRLQFNQESGEICYDISADGIDSPFDGHIHIGPEGVKGAIVVDFGALADTPIGCVDNSPGDTNAILADLANHYIELHDPNNITTVRGQLDQSTQPDGAPGDDVDDDSDAVEEPDRAMAIVQTGMIRLTGEVPNQEAADEVAAWFAGIDLGATNVVDELEIVEGAPAPMGDIVVQDDILFETDSAELVDPGSTVLAELTAILVARPSWTMTIVGHTDSSGTPAANLELSLLRAASVRDALVAAGVSPEVLTIQGAGDTEPIDSNDTPEGRLRNRRIEFRIVAQ